MAWAPIAIAAVGTVLSVAGQQQQAKAAQEGADLEAKQLERKALQRRAIGQRQAVEADRQGRLQKSRALAVAASSGAGASDPTIINHMAQLEAESNYRRMVALYEGEEEASQLEMQAKATRKGGGNAARAANLASAGTVLSSGASLYGKYGQ